LEDIGEENKLQLEAGPETDSLDKALRRARRKTDSLEKAISEMNQRIRELEEFDWEEIGELRDELSRIRGGLRILRKQDFKGSKKKELDCLSKKLNSMVKKIPKKDLDISYVFAILILVGLVLILFWGVKRQFSMEGDDPVPGYLGLLIALICLIFLIMVMDRPFFVTKKRMWRIVLAVPLAVLSGYLLIGAGIGGALILMNQLQPTLKSGWSTSSVEDGALVVRLQAPSNLGISPLQIENVSVPITITLSFDGGAEPAIIGNATVVVTGMDSPLSPNSPTPPSLRLDDTVREGTIHLYFSPSGRVEGGTLDIYYEVRHNISAGALGTFIGSETGSLSLSLKGSEFSSGWYLLCIFIGILTSFWWRVANHYLMKGEPSGLSGPTTRTKIAQYLLLPFFSLVIALAVFRQFQESLTIANDPLVSATAGFAYGFFWESVSQKFGKTVISVTSQVKETKKSAE
jgi:hypothetical protein